MKLYNKIEKETQVNGVRLERVAFFDLEYYAATHYGRNVNTTTILLNPKTLSPVYNENYVRLRDTNCTKNGFKYKVYIIQKQHTADAYTQVCSLSYFPLADGVLEFDPNELLVNYINNNDYTNVFNAFAIRHTIFQYEIVVSMIWDGQTNEINCAYWNPLFTWDGALTEAEMDSLGIILTNMRPKSSYTSTYNSYPISLMSNVGGKLVITYNAVMSGYGLGSTITISASSIYNGNHIVTSVVQVGSQIKITTATNWVWFPFGAIGFVMVEQRVQVETNVNRSLSNVPNELFLSRYDYYTADYFTNMPINELDGSHIDSGVATLVGIEIHTNTGWKWFNAYFNFTNANAVENAIISMGVGPMNLKTYGWHGYADIAHPTGSYYDLFDYFDFNEYRVYLIDGSSQLLMKPITVKMCDKFIQNTNVPQMNTKIFDRTWLVYKSHLGGWSYLPFNMKSAKKQETKNTTYNRRRKYNDNYTKRGTTVISNDITQTYTLSTDWVSIDQWKFYEDLFSSPQVFMLRPMINNKPNSTGSILPNASYDPFLPCIVSSTSTPLYKPNDDKVFSYTIEVQPANQPIRQRL